MPEQSPLPRVLRFGIFEIDLRAGELRRDGVKLKLQEQPFQLLCMLVEHPGEVVTREELRNRLWPADTFVDFDHGLNAAIKRLRDALGDSAENPRFVETVARRGYRFMGVPARPSAPAETRAKSRQWLFTARNAFLGGLTACALALSLLYYSHSFRSKTAQPTVTPVVTNVGEKKTPSLSPDGQHLAFAWNGGEGAYFSLYSKIVGTEELLRLTKQTSIDFNPVWSPDGGYIAFCRIQKGETGIYIIPALGGAERRVRKTFWSEENFAEVNWDASRLSWSPDGKLLAFSDRSSPNEPTSIFLLLLDSLEVRRLMPSFIWAYNPAFSPDGQTLAFLSRSKRYSAIYTVPVSGGQAQRLVSDVTDHWGLAWTPDGRDIVFTDAGQDNIGWLWKVPLRGGEPERLPFGQDGIELSIRGNRLVYVRQTPNLNIWRRKLNSLLSVGPPERCISSTRTQFGPQFSPDGSKIAFESTRSGDDEIWMCRSDGSDLRQLTHLNSAGTPRWSPDGQQIAFDSAGRDTVDIFVIDSQGGSPRRLTSEPSYDVVPSWSRDGHWVYFASDRTGRWEVWKMPATGEPAVQVTHQGGFAAFESPDGRFLYYAKGRSSVPGIWRIPTNGGEEIEVISSLDAGYWGYWAVVENGIYYLDTAAKPGINFFDLTTHGTMRVFDLENAPERYVPGLAISPDKKTILYTQRDALNSDIILVENFR